MKGRDRRKSQRGGIYEKRTEAKIKHNRWRGEDEGEGEVINDELAATIRL